MAIETTPGADRIQPVGGEPGGPAETRAWWRKPAVHTGLLGAVIGYLIGNWLGWQVQSASATFAQGLGDPRDWPVALAYVPCTVGCVAGMGLSNDRCRLMVSRH